MHKQSNPAGISRHIPLAPHCAVPLLSPSLHSLTSISHDVPLYTIIKIKYYND